MAMPFYMEITILYDVEGRQIYISSDDKQEEIVIQSPYVDFSEEIAFNHKNKKQNETWSPKEEKLVPVRVIEGYEIMHSLPNIWYYNYKSGVMSEEELKEKLDALTKKTIETKRTKTTGQYPNYQYAAHFNKKGDAKRDDDGNPTGEYYKEDNFNLHIIFTERTTKTNNFYSRNIYLAADGSGSTSVRKKAHILPNGEPMILRHRGESKGNFSSKAPEYSSRVWYGKRRREIENYWQHDLGIELKRQYVYFKQYKHGEGSESTEIKRKNKLLLEADILVEEFQSKDYTFPTKRLDDVTNPAFSAFLKEVIEEDENKNMRKIVERHGIPPFATMSKATSESEDKTSEKTKKADKDISDTITPVEVADEPLAVKKARALAELEEIAELEKAAERAEQDRIAAEKAEQKRLEAKQISQKYAEIQAEIDRKRAEVDAHRKTPIGQLEFEIDRLRRSINDNESILQASKGSDRKFYKSEKNKKLAKIEEFQAELDKLLPSESEQPLPEFASVEAPTPEEQPPITNESQIENKPIVDSKAVKRQHAYEQHKQKMAQSNLKQPASTSVEAPQPSPQPTHDDQYGS